MKRNILIYSPNDKITFRDLSETNFYLNLEKYFEVTWLFPGKLKKKIITKGDIKILKNDTSVRNYFWTILFYLEELQLYSFWNWPNLNTQLYLSKKMRFIIKAIYKIKIGFIFKFFCNLYLKNTYKKLSFFSKSSIFINISGGKDLLADDLTRNAKYYGLKTIFIPAGWDNISSKPLLEKPDEICVWGKQSNELCKKVHKLNSHIIGVSKFDIYKKKITKKKALNKLNLNPNYKYILVSGSSVVFNEKKFINRLENYLNKHKKNYKIIYRPHPFSQIRKFDENINFNKSKRIILDPSIKTGFELKKYPYILSSVEGVITPYSTMIVEGISNHLPCMTLGYFEKNYVHFNWKSFVLNAPHLRVLKKIKFIIPCLHFSSIEYSLKKFFHLIEKKNKYKSQMIKLSNNLVFQSNLNYAQKLKKIIYNSNV